MSVGVKHIELFAVNRIKFMALMFYLVAPIAVIISITRQSNKWLQDNRMNIMKFLILKY